MGHVNQQHGTIRVVRKGNVQQIELCQCHPAEELPTLTEQGNIMPEVKSVIEILHRHIEEIGKKVDSNSQTMVVIHEESKSELKSILTDHIDKTGQDMSEVHELILKNSSSLTDTSSDIKILESNLDSISRNLQHIYDDVKSEIDSAIFKAESGLSSLKFNTEAQLSDLSARLMVIKSDLGDTFRLINEIEREHTSQLLEMKFKIYSLESRTLWDMVMECFKRS